MCTIKVNDMVAREIDIKTTYTYNKPDMMTNNETGQFRKAGTYIIRLKDIIINNIEKEVANFYAPDLKFFLYPIVWDESGHHIQCRPQENIEVLSDLGNIVLGANNTRELSNKNQIIFSSKDVRGQIGIVLMGIIFDKKATLNKQLMNDIKKEIRKSQLNKLIRSNTNIGDVNEGIKTLFKQLTANIACITKIYCLANYKSNQIIESCDPPCNPLILIDDQQNIIEIQSEILT